MKKNKPHIVLGITGSIAAYKAVELLRLMIKQEWEVSVIMTAAATRFVGELTLRTLSRHPVVLDGLGRSETWLPAHIALADQADALLIAPCTANVLAKLAHGLADDALTATALACEAPLIIAPAMNAKMWAHPATQANLQILRKRRALVVEVRRGELASGAHGPGALAPLPAILVKVKESLAPPRRRPSRKGALSSKS